MTVPAIGLPNRELQPGELDELTATDVRRFLVYVWAPSDPQHVAAQVALCAELKRLLPDCTIDLRVEQRGDLGDAATEAARFACVVEAFAPFITTARWRNEPNIESPGVTPTRWRVWLAAFLKEARKLCSVEVCPPAVSPGTPDWLAWLKATVWAAAEAGCEAIDVHAYGSSEEIDAVLVEVRKVWTNRIVVTEFNFGPGPDRVVDLVEYAKQLPAIWRVFRRRKVEAAAWFIWEWHRPDTPMRTVPNARGTAIAAALGALAKTTANMPRNIPGGGAVMIEGLALWVWYWDDRYLDVAKRVGATTLLVKAADGTDAWEQWTTAASKCQERGITAIPWAYSYGDPREVDVLVQAAKLAGWHSIIVDPETEFERRLPEQQREFVEALRSAKQSHHLSIGCACWSRPEAHGGYPFDTLAEVVDFWLPMIAWQAWEPRDAARWLDHWDSFGYKPTVPWLPAYEGVTADELAASVKLALERYGAATVWAAHTLTDEHIAALEDVQRNQTQTRNGKNLTSDPPAIDRPAAIDALNGIAHHLGQANAALETARQEQERVWAEVVELKRAIGLE